MGVLLKPAHSQEIQAVGGQQHKCKHGQNGDHTEYYGYLCDAPCTVLGSRVHKDGYQWFTWPQEEDGEQDPWGYVVFVAMIMSRLLMGVIMLVGVFMQMQRAISMTVFMFMMSFPGKAPDSPEQITQAKEHKQPGGKISPDGFQEFQSVQTDTDTDPYRTQKYGTDHMSESA